MAGKNQARGIRTNSIQSMTCNTNFPFRPGMRKRE